MKPDSRPGAYGPRSAMSMACDSIACDTPGSPASVCSPVLTGAREGPGPVPACSPLSALTESRLSAACVTEAPAGDGPAPCEVCALRPGGGGPENPKTHIIDTEYINI